MPESNNSRYREWKMNVPFMLKEYPMHPQLAWSAAKFVDLYLIKLTGGVPRGSSGKG